MAKTRRWTVALPNGRFGSEADRALRGLAKRCHIGAPTREGAAALMDGSRLDDKATPLKRGTKGVIGRGLLRINPDHQLTGWTEEFHQPIQRGLKGQECAPTPIDQRYIILACRKAAIRHTRHMKEAAMI